MRRILFVAHDKHHYVSYDCQHEMRKINIIECFQMAAALYFHFPLTSSTPETTYQVAIINGIEKDFRK